MRIATVRTRDRLVGDRQIGTWSRGGASLSALFLMAVKEECRLTKLAIAPGWAELVKVCTPRGDPPVVAIIGDDVNGHPAKTTGRRTLMLTMSVPSFSTQGGHNETRRVHEGGAIWNW